ncbi:hypothetical protein CVT26_006233 [Gymnopilus dilepis]|uniref:Uncharacterized protein n=1 Tax=Gymnopilus dilepis TaxID=231916 RepID=A0A409Y1D5_9AGAR|nr:hypothetical protein CVT26_006233 [Gymnopilus dilepis]
MSNSQPTRNQRLSKSFEKDADNSSYHSTTTQLLHAAQALNSKCVLEETLEALQQGYLIFEDPTRFGEIVGV